MNDIKAYAGRVILLGRLGENEYTRVAFDVSNWIEQYPNATLSIANMRPGDTDAYPVSVAHTEQTDGVLYWTITNTELSAEGNGQCQLTATENNVIVKSIIFETLIGPALDGSGEVPEPWEDWRQDFADMADEAKTASTQAVNAATSAAQSSDDAADSARAASDIADEIKELTAEAETLPAGSSATADYDAETGVLNIGVPVGDNGDPGVSPTVTVTDITGGHRVTITDADGAHSFDVMDGDVADVPVNDVQILDVSCVDDKIAKIPTATNDTVGVVSGGNKGVVVTSSQATPGQLMISPATLGVMKNPGGFANSIYLPITASHEHEATFYGLAKAAGDATQSASSNQVGTYTDDAKAAIQTMLGVPSISDIPTIPVQSVNGKTGAVVLDAQDVGAYEKPATGIPASDLASGVIPEVHNIPSGGTTGQVLSKASGTDYDTTWTTPSGVPVTDVQVNGVSVVSGGVANVPVGTGNRAGVVQGWPGGGTQILQDGRIATNSATVSDTKTQTHSYKPIVPNIQHAATFFGLAKAAGDTTQSQSSNAVGTYTDSAKSAISQMLNSPVTISGSTPTITALPGVRYVCGECATLDITLPASGCVDVVFESGSTATVLSITPPTGVTVKWANGFDPSSLDADTTYEINIADGLGVAGSWT